jgi:pyruvate ferredoxin oxidoreductase alpha subunit
MEHKVLQAEAMKAAKARILEVAAEFERISGRSYGLLEEYRMEDAELALVLIGSTAGTAKAAVDRLREKGVKAGLVKIRVFRPFPGQELAKALAGTRAVAVMDKSEGFSANGGPLFSETCSALYDCKERPYLINIVYGLGGRDVTTGDIEKLFGRLANIAETGDIGSVYTHMGQRSREEIA